MFVNHVLCFLLQVCLFDIVGLQGHGDGVKFTTMLLTMVMVYNTVVCKEKYTARCRVQCVIMWVAAIGSWGRIRLSLSAVLG